MISKAPRSSAISSVSSFIHHKAPTRLRVRVVELVLQLIKPDARVAHVWAFKVKCLGREQMDAVASTAGHPHELTARGEADDG